MQLTPVALERFPDSELHVEVQESVRGHNVYIIQPTCPPVDEHLLELLLMGDACRRVGAIHLTGRDSLGRLRPSATIADETSVVAQIFDCLEVSIFLKELLFFYRVGILNWKWISRKSLARSHERAAISAF